MPVSAPLDGCVAMASSRPQIQYKRISDGETNEESAPSFQPEPRAFLFAAKGGG